MDEPKEVWGVYAVQGAATAAKLRRTGPDSYEIESAYLEPDDGKTLPLHVASLMLHRRGLRGEPAVVALPDAAGFLGTVRIAPRDAARPEAAVAERLYDATPFDAGHAQLRHVRVADVFGDEVHLVAAAKHSAVSAALHELEHKRPLPAVAFGGAAIVRGAAALGLTRDVCVLVEVEPHLTVAYLVDGPHVRRRVIPFGEREIVRDATNLKKLVDELLHAAEDRPESAEGTPAPAGPVPFVLVGPGAASQRVQTLLGAKLGGRLADGVAEGARVRLAGDARMHRVPLQALAGAVGAALEATTPAGQRLLFRELPADLHAHREHPARPWAVAAAVTLGVFVAYQAWQRLRPADAADAGASSAKPTPGDVVLGGAETAVETTRPAAEAPVAAALRVETIAPGRVRVTWPAGKDGRVLRRFGESWTDVATIGAGAGSMEDEVAGGRASYSWRLDDDAPVVAKIAATADVESVAPAGKGGARFVLRRTWRGATCTATVDVAPGEPIRATSRCGSPPTDVVLDAGCSLVGVRTRTATEDEPVRVPRFDATGRVERGSDGTAVLETRVVPRSREVWEAEAATGEGPMRVWTKRVGD